MHIYTKKGKTMTNTYRDLIEYNHNGLTIKLRSWSHGWVNVYVHRDLTLVDKRTFRNAFDAMEWLS